MLGVGLMAEFKSAEFGSYDVIENEGDGYLIVYRHEDGRKWKLWVWSELDHVEGEEIIVCPVCKGRGTQTLHGHAYTADEMYEQGPDFIEDYMSGVYDHACDHCGGSKETTQSDLEYAAEVAAEMRYMHGI